MRYVTHHFANLETLDRARRWLVQLGFAPDQIESHTDGVPRLAVMVRPEQADEVRQLINAAELTDPKGWPSFWDVAHQTHVYPCALPIRPPRRRSSTRPIPRPSAGTPRTLTVRTSSIPPPWSETTGESAPIAHPYGPSSGPALA